MASQKSEMSVVARRKCFSDSSVLLSIESLLLVSFTVTLFLGAQGYSTVGGAIGGTQHLTCHVRSARGPQVGFLGKSFSSHTSIRSSDLRGKRQPVHCSCYSASEDGIEKTRGNVAAGGPETRGEIATRGEFMKWLRHATATAMLSTVGASAVTTVNSSPVHSASWKIQDIKDAIERDFVKG